MKNLRTLAVLHICQGDYCEAIELLDEALAITLRLLAEPHQIAHSCTCRGWARLRQDRVEEAIPDFWAMPGHRA